MKKITIWVITAFFMITPVAASSIAIGPAWVDDVFNANENYDRSIGVYYTPSISAQIDLDYTFFESNTRFNYRLGFLDDCYQDFQYWDLQNKTKIKYNSFYIGTELDWGTYTKYVTTFAGFKFTSGNLWADAYAGWVFLDEAGHWEDNGNVITSITVGTTLWDVVKIWAGMDSTEYPLEGKFILGGFRPIAVRNTIGFSIELSNFLFQVDYYCKHPEVACGNQVTFANSNKSTIMIGYKINF